MAHCLMKEFVSVECGCASLLELLSLLIQMEVLHEARSTMTKVHPSLVHLHTRPLYALQRFVRERSPIVIIAFALNFRYLMAYSRL